MTPTLFIAALVGLSAGLIFFGSLSWSIERILGGRMALGLGVQVLRFFGLAGLLILAARAGAGPLAAMSLGVFAARWLWTSRIGRRA